MKNKTYSRTEPLDVLNLPEPLKQLLVNNGVKTVGKLCKLKRSKLLKMKGVGKQTIRKIMSYRRHIKLISYFDDPALSGSTTSYTPIVSKESGYSKSSIFGFKESLLTSELAAADPIEILGLPTRTENTLKMNDIETIADFYQCPPERMFKFRNFGEKSIKFLEQIKVKIQPLLNIDSFKSNHDEEKPTQEAIKVNIEEEIPNDKLIDLIFQRAKDSRSQDILKRRYGLGTGQKETLEEVGKSYGVTRERIRQIQEKTIKKMQHPSTKGRLQIIRLVNEMMLKNGIVISDYEADNLVPSYFNNSDYDGSSLLDLMSDLGWIQKNRIGDVDLYAPRDIISGTNITKLNEEIYSMIKTEGKLVPVESIISHFKERYYENTDITNISQIVLRLCRLDPRIEEKLPNKLGLYSSHPSVKDWRNHIVDVLTDEGVPLHFTEVTEKVNTMLGLTEDNRLDVRRVHCILIENTEFSHSGVRGTYGLTKWGLRKEMTPVLVEEVLVKSGRPLHWRQIFNYVKKYKDTKEANILSILNTNKKFIKHGHGEYALEK